ncbi:MAG: glycosyltransferase family 39 protein [Acidimicrobiales bacterium]
MNGRLQGRRGRRWVLGIVVLGALVRIWAPGPTTETYDEPLWLARTDQFVDALRSGDLDRATPGDGRAVTTMPGVTVMWSGAVGRAVAEGAGAVGLIAPVHGPSTASPAVLRAGRAVEAVAASLALGALVWIASRLVGARASLIAGALLATDPFLAGHGNLLHTDSLVTMFAALGVVAAMASVWSTDPAEPRARGALVAVSGVASALALLTKLNAIPVLAPPLLAIVGVELVDRIHGGGGRSRRARLRGLAAGVGGWVLAASSTALVLWPALWTSPMTQVERMRQAAELTTTAAPVAPWAPLAERRLFVPVSLLVRLTPWMALAGSVAVLAIAVALVARRWPAAAPRRRVVALLVLAPLPYLAYLERQPRVFDRYLLPLWPFLALAIGIVVVQLVEAVRPSPTVRRSAAAVAVVALAGAALAVAPYGSAYADPLVGARRTEAWLSLGWGEGVERLGQTIERIEGPRCPEVTIAVRYPLRIALPCGQLVRADDPRAASVATYVIVEVRHRQRRTLPIYDLAVRDGRWVETVRIGGVPYAELWRLP